MRKNIKSTPLLMSLVLSIIATQLSLNAFGINIAPSLTTIIHSWGKVASMIGGVYQPDFVAELDALSNHFLCSDGKVLVDTEKPSGELACQKGNEFDFELPPPIDVNDPSVIIKEPVIEYCPKAISRTILKKESNEVEALASEVLQIAADSDEESPASETNSQAIEESVRSITTGIASDAAEPENKVFAPQFENKIFFSAEDAQVSPKAEKNRKPCPELERLKKFEETRKFLNEFQFETELQFVNERKPDFDTQAFQAHQFLEKAKRVRIIIKMNPLALPRPLNKESMNLLNIAEESEF